MTPNSEMPCLRIVRRFDVPPDKVFDALTEPDAMRVWWGDDTAFDIDLRVGGRWTITRRADGMEYIATGQYLAVERPWRLSYTYSMPQFSPNSDTITVEIAPDGGGCVITFVQTGEDIANELREVPPGGTSGSEAGWQQGFDLMAAAWARQAEPNNVTIILQRVREGSAEAKNELITSLYDRFRQRAHQRLRHERPGHSLATTDLTNEALLRMLKNDELAKAADGNQLFRAFARAMRRVLIDHARRRNADKRGGRRRREELDDLADHVSATSQIEMLALHEALEALAGEHPRAAAVLEMRFFGGCDMAEIAEALSSESDSVSLRTVERDSRLGLAWLHDYLSPESAS